MPRAVVLEIGVLAITILEIGILAIAVLEISVLYAVDRRGVARLLERRLEGAEQCRLHLPWWRLPLMFIIELIEELLEGVIIRMLLLQRWRRWGWWWRRWGWWWWGWRRCTAGKGPGRVWPSDVSQDPLGNPKRKV
jgi:hypothetical protein